MYNWPRERLQRGLKLSFSFIAHKVVYPKNHPVTSPYLLNSKLYIWEYAICRTQQIFFYPFLRSQTQPNWTFSRPEKIHSQCSFNLTLGMEVKLLAGFIYTARQAADGQYNCTIQLNKTGPSTVFLWLDWSCQDNCRSPDPSGPHEVCYIPETVFVCI